MESIAKPDLNKMHSNNELPIIHFDCSKHGKSISIFIMSYCIKEYV